RYCRPKHFPYTTLFRSANDSAKAPLMITSPKLSLLPKTLAYPVNRPSGLSSSAAFRPTVICFVCMDPPIKTHLLPVGHRRRPVRSEEHTSELQSRFDLV